MKSNTFIAILFALSVLILVVSGQDSSTSTSTSTSSTLSAPSPASTVDQNKIDECIKNNNCGSDQDCRAKCAGVPNPSHSGAQNTDDCVSKCNQNDTTAYAQCKQNCISSNYFNPSASPSTGNTANTNAPPSSQSASSTSSGSTPSSTSKQNNANGASSFTTSSNAFTALVLCVIAGVMAVS